ncbi:MAG: helix-turn-helix transcriptional regulator [Geminicoccaceae bacterium]
MTRHTAKTSIPHQVIRDARGEPEYAVVPYAEFVRLSRSEEDLRDRQMAEEALAEESLPWPMAKRLLHGASPIKVWREYRGLSQRQLAEAVGARATYVSQLETGRKRPSLDLAITLARTLSVTIDDLVGGPPD